MASDITHTVEPVWGSPQPAPAGDSSHSVPTQWSRGKTLAAVGIAAALAAGGAAVIHAADTGSQGGPGGGPGWGPGEGGPGGGGPGGGGPGGGPGTPVSDALHGVFVVADGHGGFTTELTQTGTVTDVVANDGVATAITARSADGFTQTYTINTDTRQRQPVQAGQTATIRAVQSGGANTATAISPAH